MHTYAHVVSVTRSSWSPHTPTHTHHCLRGTEMLPDPAGWGITFFNLNTENSLYAHTLHNTPLTIKASSFLPQTDVSRHVMGGGGGILRSWNDNKGDCPGSHVPVWCAGAPRPAAVASRRAQPRRGPGPGPPAGATQQGRSQESSRQRWSSHTWNQKQFDLIQFLNTTQQVIA